MSTTNVAARAEGHANQRLLKSGKSGKQTKVSKSHKGKTSKDAPSKEVFNDFPGEQYDADFTDTNPCVDTHKEVQEALNITYNDCTLADDVQEQAAANVTKGFEGMFETEQIPLENDLRTYENMCVTNVHWHLGAEHLSVGEYDEAGTGPAINEDGTHKRKLAEGGTAMGRRCHYYDESDTRFTTDYDWKHCDATSTLPMKVGETYEVHWPSSTMGACGTVWQYQTPFRDGLFCDWRAKFVITTPLNEQLGVMAQVFTIINDEDYYYPDLIDGMIVDEERGVDIAKYTGSTTGQSVSNTKCSGWAPVTWHADRKCHLISASSFDKLCYDMLAKKADMANDTRADGSRIVVAQNLTADNLERL